jgi:hypothetical protein
MSFTTTGNLVSGVNIDIGNGLLSNADDSKITVDGDLDVKERSLRQALTSLRLQIH